MGITNIVVAIPSIVVLIPHLDVSAAHNIGFLKGIGGLAFVHRHHVVAVDGRAVRAQASSVATREHIDIAKLRALGPRAS